MTALLIYPTHKNCREVEEDYAGAGIGAATYPGRATEASEDIPQNCWNADADGAEAMGLPVVKAVCPRCASRPKCLEGGYLGDLIAVEKATVALCTQKRAEFSGLASLSSGRKYVSVHENPIDLLRPVVDISEQDLLQVQHVVGRVLTDPKFLDWFGDALRVDDQGNRYHDQELAIRKDRQHQFCVHLLDVIDALVVNLQRAESTAEWRPQKTMKSPTGIEWTLFLATRIAKATFQGQAWRFALSAVTGELHAAAILVSKRYVKGGGQGTAFVVKSAVGFRDNPPGAGVTTWFNDATLTRDRLEQIVCRPVRDLTPGARIELKRKQVQILRDITRGTSKRIFANILRGVLADRPQFQRVGVICLRPHIGAVRSLGAEFDQRIVKATYFGSGDDRSSNDWYQQCDLVVIAGTPRIPPSAIAAFLVQSGEVSAARREPDWGTVYWEGQTESGEAVRVKSRGYQDEAWRRAHRDQVRARLVQAVGRGRSILETGCEVIVISTEECGLVISDAGLESLNGTSTKVLEALRDLSLTFPKKLYLEKVSVSTREVARAVRLSLPQVRRVLAGLERRGLVHKVGERGGWVAVALAPEPSNMSHVTGGDPSTQADDPAGSLASPK
jgi:hypothetical protein